MTIQFFSLLMGLILLPNFSHAEDDWDAARRGHPFKVTGVSWDSGDYVGARTVAQRNANARCVHFGFHQALRISGWQNQPGGCTVDEKCEERSDGKMYCHYERSCMVNSSALFKCQ